MTVFQLELTMSYQEYIKWQYFYSEKPTGEQINEIQMARLMAMISGMFGSKSPPKVSDFMVSGSNKKDKKPTDIFGMFNVAAKDFKGA